MNVFKKIFSTMNTFNPFGLIGGSSDWNKGNFWRSLFYGEKGPLQTAFTDTVSSPLDILNDLPLDQYGEAVNKVTGAYSSAQQQLSNQMVLNDQQMANQKELMQYQRDLNSVSNQVQQFREAGMNPYQVSSAGMSSGGSAQGGSASTGHPSGMGIMEMIFGMLTQKRENELAKATVNKENELANFYKEQAEGQRIDNENKPDYWNKQLDLMDAEKELKKSLKGKTDEEKKVAAQTVKWLKHAVWQGWAKTGAQYIQALGTLIATVKGIKFPTQVLDDVEVLDAEVVGPARPVSSDVYPSLPNHPSYDQLDPATGNMLPQFGPVYGVKDFKNLGNKGIFTFDDGSELILGKLGDTDGFEMTSTGNQADDLLNRVEPFISKIWNFVENN